MIRRNAKEIPGLDFSGPSKVLPPTFAGVKQLVDRVGLAGAIVQCAPVTPPDDDASHDLVREFLADLDYMDAVERQTAISEFSRYVDYLEKLKKTTPAAGGAEKAADTEPQGKAEKAFDPATVADGAPSAQEMSAAGPE